MTNICFSNRDFHLNRELGKRDIELGSSLKKFSFISTDSSYFFYQEPEYPRDCKEVYDQCEGSSSESGIYLIKPDGANEPFQVYCNNSIDGGGWTVRT